MRARLVGEQDMCFPTKHALSACSHPVVHRQTPQCTEHTRTLRTYIRS